MHPPADFRAPNRSSGHRNGGDRFSRRAHYTFGNGSRHFSSGRGRSDRGKTRDSKQCPGDAALKIWPGDDIMNREVPELGSDPKDRRIRMLDGKTAIVTGSTSGIGAGIAVALAEAGCEVMLNGFGEPGVIQRQVDGIAKQY